MKVQKLFPFSHHKDRIYPINMVYSDDSFYSCSASVSLTLPFLTLILTSSDTIWNGAFVFLVGSLTSGDIFLPFLFAPVARLSDLSHCFFPSLCPLWLLPDGCPHGLPSHGLCSCRLHLSLPFAENEVFRVSFYSLCVFLLISMEVT